MSHRYTNTHTDRHILACPCVALTNNDVIPPPSDLANCRYRIQVVESNWPYFVGFGAPITLLMLLPQYYVVR